MGTAFQYAQEGSGSIAKRAIRDSPQGVSRSPTEFCSVGHRSALVIREIPLAMEPKNDLVKNWRTSGARTTLDENATVHNQVKPLSTAF